MAKDAFRDHHGRFANGHTLTKGKKHRNKRSPEYLSKLSQARIGKRPSNESIEKNRAWHNGRKLSVETRNKISNSLKGRNVGADNPSWKGGTTKERIKIWHSEIYSKWRQAVFLRDNFTCRICGKNNVFLNAHHIKEYAIYPELRFNLNNGLTLCKECHKLIHKGRQLNQYSSNKND